MKVDVLLGLQWGDEGKGKIVDVLTPDYDVIADSKAAPTQDTPLNLMASSTCCIPSPAAWFSPDTLNVVGNGVVIDPIIFKRKSTPWWISAWMCPPAWPSAARRTSSCPPIACSMPTSEDAKGKAKIGGR